jgi:ABC-type amino acid transport substrate-binding protein
MTGIVLGIILFSFVCGKNTEAGETMKIGYFTLAPHSFAGTQKSKPVGAAVDYMERYVAPEMDVRIEWSLLPFSRMMKYLDEGTIDAALLLGKNSERLEKYLFPAEPVTSEITGLAINKSCSLTRINTANDLKGLKIGFTKDGYLSPFMRNKQLRFDFTVGTETIWQQFLKKLEAGRIDAAYNPTLTVLKYEAKLLGLTDKLKFIELPEPRIGLYTVFSKSSADLFKRYDTVHAALCKRHNYEDFLKKYLE